MNIDNANSVVNVAETIQDTVHPAVDTGAVQAFNEGMSSSSNSAATSSANAEANDNIGTLNEPTTAVQSSADDSNSANTSGNGNNNSNDKSDKQDKSDGSEVSHKVDSSDESDKSEKKERRRGSDRDEEESVFRKDKRDNIEEGKGNKAMSADPMEQMEEGARLLENNEAVTENRSDRMQEQLEQHLQQGDGDEQAVQTFIQQLLSFANSILPSNSDTGAESASASLPNLEGLTSDITELQVMAESLAHQMSSGVSSFGSQVLEGAFQSPEEVAAEKEKEESSKPSFA